MSKPTRSHGSKRFTSRRTRSSKTKLEEAREADVQELFGEDSSSLESIMLPEGSKTDKKSGANDNVSRKKKGVPKKITESATKAASDSDNDDKPIKEYLVPIVQGDIPVKDESASELDEDMKPSAAKIPRLDIPDEKPKAKSAKIPDLLHIPLPTVEKDGKKKEISASIADNMSEAILIESDEKGITDTEKKQIPVSEAGNISEIIEIDSDEKETPPIEENIPTEAAEKEDIKDETEAAVKNITSEETKIGEDEKQEKSSEEQPCAAEESKIIKDSPSSPDPAENNDVSQLAPKAAEKQDDVKEILPLDPDNKPAEVSDDAAATLAAIDSAIEELMAGANAAVAAAQNEAAGEQNPAEVSDAAREGSVSPLAPLVMDQSE